MILRSPAWIVEQVFLCMARGEPVDLVAARAQTLGVRDQLVCLGRDTGRDLTPLADPFLEVLDLLEAEDRDGAWDLFTVALCAMLGLGPQRHI